MLTVAMVRRALRVRATDASSAFSASGAPVTVTVPPSTVLRVPLMFCGATRCNAMGASRRSVANAPSRKSSSCFSAHRKPAASRSHLSVRITLVDIAFPA